MNSHSNDGGSLDELRFYSSTNFRLSWLSNKTSSEIALRVKRFYHRKTRGITPKREKTNNWQPVPFKRYKPHEEVWRCHKPERKTHIFVVVWNILVVMIWWGLPIFQRQIYKRQNWKPSREKIAIPRRWMLWVLACHFFCLGRYLLCNGLITGVHWEERDFNCELHFLACRITIAHSHPSRTSNVEEGSYHTSTKSSKTKSSTSTPTPAAALVLRKSKGISVDENRTQTKATVYNQSSKRVLAYSLTRSFSQCLVGKWLVGCLA